MSFLVNIYGQASIQCLSTAELATFIASNPIDKSAVCDIDNQQLVYYDDDTQTLIPFVSSGGGTTYTKYVRAHTGANYSSADLIGSTVKLMLMDSLPRYEVASSPDEGSEFSFDDTTGTITIGTAFSENDLVIQYSSFTAPAAP